MFQPCGEVGCAECDTRIWKWNTNLLILQVVKLITEKVTIMKLLYCDETNLEERSGDFLIYGGLMVDAEASLALSHAIDELRIELGVPRDYQLKFNPGPVGFSHEQFIELKKRCLEIAHQHEAKLMVYTILHDIASSPDEARRNGINSVCMHFQMTLEQINLPGLVLVDRFTDDGQKIDAHLREKFNTGVVGLPYTPTMRLKNIVGLHYSAIGQSHIPSLVDVALGSLRFAMNAHTREQSKFLATAGALIQMLSPMFWRPQHSDDVPEIGFQFSPKTVKSPRYKTKYEQLKAFLSEHGLNTMQQITSDRTY